MAFRNFLLSIFLSCSAVYLFVYWLKAVLQSTKSCVVVFVSVVVVVVFIIIVVVVVAILVVISLVIFAVVVVAVFAVFN